MRRTTVMLGVAAILLAVVPDSAAQRGGRGGGGARGGGVRPGGGGGGAVRGGAVAGPYGGGGAAPRSAGTVVGPAGGTRSAGSGSGSYTTGRGTTIDYGAAGRGGTTPGGVNYGRGVGGVQATTPGGREVNRVGTAGGVAGPGGNAAGQRTGVTTGTGPSGSFGSAYHGGVAVGPHGATAGGTRAGTATGPGGTVSGAARAGAAAGPYGAVAGGTRAGAARSPYGTYYASSSALRTTGTTVRGSYRYYNAFTPGWYAKYPGAWLAAGWTAARIWSAPAWGTVSGYCSYPTDPIYYNYGENVVYDGANVVIDGTSQIPTEQYVQQAADLATAGKEARVEPKGDDFQPLGVFAMVGEGETKSTNIFQLAVSKDGIIRGNYYNALTDTTEPVYGSVNKETQRAAWTVGDRKTPLYDAGIANLTKDETTMLVHYTKDNTQQFTLVRVRQPEGEAAPDGKDK